MPYLIGNSKYLSAICIGTQEWLASNLCETKYRNGSNIPEVSNSSIWGSLTTGAMCAYNNDWYNVFNHVQ